MTENLPLVSVIMPAYNSAGYICEAIESVINQSYQNWELLIVDDKSSDDTAKIVEEFEFKDRRIHLFVQKENSGPAAARNKAIYEAKGEYLAFLDSDDKWYPDKLEKQLNFMREHDCAFCCSAYKQVDERGNPTGKIVIPYKKANYKRCLYYGNCVGNSTAVYKLGPNGKIYAPEIRKRNDFALWLKILRVEPYVFGIQEILADYRVRENSISSNKMNLIGYQWQLYRKIEKLSLIRCVIAFGCLFFRKVFKK